MCLMQDQFLWEHLSRDCDISCFNRHGTVVVDPGPLMLGVHVLDRRTPMTPPLR